MVVPILNEEAFLPLYLESVTSFADEILIVDGGSTDRSLEIICSFQKDFNIRLFKMQQTGLPYTEDWNESGIRNFLIDQATGDWIIAPDADEIFDDRFIELLPDLMKQKDAAVYTFRWINFWKDPWTVRVNAPRDERWSVDVIKMWRNHIGIWYNAVKHHCSLQLNGRGVWELSGYRTTDIPLYHYHYALGRRIKVNDNRRGDVNAYSDTDKPDWTYRPESYEIRTQPFTGKHPLIVEQYLASLKVNHSKGGQL